MPNFENLKKTAKLYLRWHRERHVPVAAQIRSWLPGFAELSDQVILDLPLKLADMQRLVAREGFATWEALKEGLPNQDRPASRTPIWVRSWVAEPQLLVRDIGVSCDFYPNSLGFDVNILYGRPAFYAQVHRAGARLNSRRVRKEILDARPSDLERDLLSATIALDDAKALFLEYQAAGVPFHQRLRREPWGARTFIVRDPDGNLIAFAS